MTIKKHSEKIYSKIVLLGIYTEKKNKRIII